MTTNLINDVVKIGNQEYLNIGMEDFLNLPPAYTQRNSPNRLPKMKKTFDQSYLKGRPETLEEVALGYAEIDFCADSGLKVNKGSWCILDAATRQYYWRSNPDQAKVHTNGLTARVWRLYSHEDVEAAYYPYNSAKSAENKADVIQGLNRKHQWTPRQTVFANGMFGEALKFATTNPCNPSDCPDVFEAYDQCFDSLKMLDKLPKGSTNGITKPATKTAKSAFVIAGCIKSLNVYMQGTSVNVNLLDFIQRYSTITEEELQTCLSNRTADPVQMVALEYTGMSAFRTGMTAEKIKPTWLDGKAGSTKRADIVPNMDFVLYQIGKYIAKPTDTVDLGHINTNMWKDEWAENWI